jgi:hypothetical protein
VRDGFDQFVADRLDRLLRYATAITCDRHLAQDIVQDVLLRARPKWGRIGAMDARPRHHRPSGDQATIKGGHRPDGAHID